MFPSNFSEYEVKEGRLKTLYVLQTLIELLKVILILDIWWYTLKENVRQTLKFQWVKVIYIVDISTIYDSTPSTNIHWNFNFLKNFLQCRLIWITYRAGSSLLPLSELSGRCIYIYCIYTLHCNKKNFWTCQLYSRCQTNVAEPELSFLWLDPEYEYRT